MNRACWIGILCYLACLQQLRAQNTDDSVSRILDRISAGDTIRINPEFMKSIESGKFLNITPDYPGQLLSPPGLPILKDFSEYIYSDSTQSLVPVNKLPASVIMRQGLDIIIKDTILQSFMIHASDLERLRGDYMSSGPIGIGGRFSMEDVLRHIFWKSERAKKRNRKNANAYKFYNKMP